jgi:hypothetical protein
MADTKGAGKSQASDASGASTSGAASTGDDLRRVIGEAYFKYADAVQPGRIQQGYEQAYEEYARSLRDAERAALQRYSDAYGRLQQAYQEAQRVTMSAHQGLAQGRGEGSPADAYGQYVDALSEAQRRQEEAYRAFANEVRQLWSDDLQRPAQEALQKYAEAVQSANSEVARQAQEASRAYLASIKEFWSRLDVDAAAASLARRAR